MQRTEIADFLQRVLIVAGVVVVLFLFWQARQVLLLTFVAILMRCPLVPAAGWSSGERGCRAAGPC